MARCLISFGANIGNPRATILAAAELLKAQLCPLGSNPLGSNPSSSVSSGEPFRLSRYYRTPPVGGPSGQSPFVNAVAAIETERSVWEVWYAIREIEHQLGRERNQRWEARRIDLDILLYDQQRIWTPHLKVPHPRMCMRRFILIPALDVASDWIDPVSGWTIAQLAEGVRSGPSNFALIAAPGAESQAPSPEAMLAEVARRTGATWRTPTQHSRSGAVSSAIASGTSGTSSSSFQSDSDEGRWLSWIAKSATSATSATDPILDLPFSKLVIILAPPTRSIDAAWEDYHRQLAHQLDLDSSDGKRRMIGPRYLLASDDPPWAIQEMIAALEAMDCPVEVLPP